MTDKSIIRKMDDVKSNPVDRSEGATIQVLLGADDAMPNYYTRRFTLNPGAKIPSHRHDDIEHQQVILEGEMVVILDGKEQLAREGDVLYLPAKVFHSYENRGSLPCRFLCIIPAVSNYTTEWADPDSN